jgi:iron(III) transport system ATP-binding protein
MLEIRGVSKAYGETPVLRGIDLSVEPGELMFLLGPSGCGKSTLLRIVAGLIRQDAGSVILGGRDVSALPPESRNTPMVFQNYALWPHLNVAENIEFGLKIRKLPRTEIRETVDEMLAVVGMSEFAKRKVNELSGGQQQRVALARALALKGDILLLDEPLSNLDARLRDLMRTEIRRICKERRLTALYVTHDRREALSVGDRIAVMRDGVILQLDSPRTLYTRPADRFTAAFLGDADFPEAKCLRNENGFAVFSAPMGELRVRLDGQPVQPAPGAACTLMIRPEAVRPGADPASVNAFPCTVRDSVFLGETTGLTLDASGFTLHASESAAPERHPGDTIPCAVPPEAIAILPPEEAR